MRHRQQHLVPHHGEPRLHPVRLLSGLQVDAQDPLQDSADDSHHLLEPADLLVIPARMPQTALAGAHVTRAARAADGRASTHDAARLDSHAVFLLQPADGDPEREFHGGHDLVVPVPGIPRRLQRPRDRQLLDDVLHLLPLHQGVPRHVLQNNRHTRTQQRDGAAVEKLKDRCLMAKKRRRARPVSPL